jgi:queuine tRNA-ribosyltransferase
VKFEIKYKDKLSKARNGFLETAHGVIETPVFMPVGTNATVKAIQFYELEEIIGAEIILGNTYHLYLRPGADLIQEAGGLHLFNSWKKPMLTDSGGYQVYSLSNNRKIKEEGVTFQSHVDGAKHFFTPENVMDIQRSIGADIIMAFDECTPYPCEYKYAEKSMHLTHRWLERCIKQFDNTTCPHGYEQTLSPIVQGSTFTDLRKQSAEFIANCNRPMNAIGGLSVGEPAPEMYAMVEVVNEILPWDKPRYLMGVGTPENILECIALGIDMFDCVMPTRNARNGQLFTTKGILNIRNEKWKTDFSAIDEALPIPTSQRHSKAYLRHLFYANEMLAAQIASLQNVGFYIWLVKQAREEIKKGTFQQWKDNILKTISQKL